ncbi:hypothetical protein ABT297_04450 [Dactylosporangium sp. NPDC000555]|uniref:hypothetical protein n=1 Tax=Dactylosporangium sp. NPDC000555 TaxID=3154260 RepID=UPI00333261B6
MDPSKPNDPSVDQSQPIPRSRPGNDEILEGEIIDRGVPIGRPRTAPPPSAPPPPPRKRPSARRTVLLVLAAVAALVCLGGSLTAYVLYDKATEPDRGSPTATLRQYLDARFNKRDVTRANVFACSIPDLSAVDKALEDVEQLETKFSIAITMFTSNMAVTTQAGDSATVRVRINLEIPEDGSRRSIKAQEWQFGTVRSSSWRVCSATKLS